MQSHLRKKKYTYSYMYYIMFMHITQTTILCLHVIACDYVNCSEFNECTVEIIHPT